MGRAHHYQVEVTWTGNEGQGTATHRAYSRAHEIAAAGKWTIEGSSDPSFRGDQTRWNPEELLLASLSTCHQLWYLSLCAEAGLVVVAYRDCASGTMVEEADGAGQFVSVVLRPDVTLGPGSDIARAEALHAEAHTKCFVARSVNFPITHEPTITIGA